MLNDLGLTEVLAELARASAALVIRDEHGHERRRIAGSELAKLINVTNRLQDLVRVAERHGIPFTVLLESRDRDAGVPRRWASRGTADQVPA